MTPSTTTAIVAHGADDLRVAALAEPAGVAWHAVAQAGDLSGKRVLVVGSGPVGALAADASMSGEVLLAL
jgi:threonine dehydrogenase-like Zn-dependent dehydrogenase